MPIRFLVLQYDKFHVLYIQMSIEGIKKILNLFSSAYYFRTGTYHAIRPNAPV